MFQSDILKAEAERLANRASELSEQASRAARRAEVARNKARWHEQSLIERAKGTFIEAAQVKVKLAEHKAEAKRLFEAQQENSRNGKGYEPTFQEKGYGRRYFEPYGHKQWQAKESYCNRLEKKAREIAVDMYHALSITEREALIASLDTVVPEEAVANS